MHFNWPIGLSGNSEYPPGAAELPVLTAVRSGDMLTVFQGRVGYVFPSSNFDNDDEHAIPFSNNTLWVGAGLGFYHKMSESTGIYTDFQLNHETRTDQTFPSASIYILLGTQPIQ